MERVAAVLAFHRLRDPFGNFVGGGDKCSVGPANVMTRSHASSSVPEQFADGRIAIPFIRRNARECPPQIVSASVVQSCSIKEGADLLFQIGRSGARLVWENQFVVERIERRCSTAALPMARIDLPVFDSARRKQPLSKSTSLHRRP